MSNIRKTFGDKSFTIGKGGGSATPDKIQVIQIIDGNEIDNIDCIKMILPETTNNSLTIPVSGADYATLPLPDGYGRAWLFEYTDPPADSDGIVSPDNGITGRVLVQNSSILNFGLPLMAGNSYYVATTVDVSGSNGTFTCYIPRGV